MNKEEFTRKYGETVYEKRLQRACEWNAQHREERNITCGKWRAANPDKVAADSQEHNRKGGKYYAHALKHNTTGLRGQRHIIRSRHGRKYRPFKKIIAPSSQCHHQWVPGTAEYTGVALVEKDQHMHGFIDVIQILEGEITLLTEAEIRGT